MLKNYKAQWRYRSGSGQFDESEIVQLEEEQAASFNRDSPGVLVPMSDAENPLPAEGRVIAGPPHDRMMTGENLKKRGLPENSGAPDATEAAIKLAEEHDIDLAGVSGSGADGRILKSDIEKLI